jgi:hypothetical protein
MLSPDLKVAVRSAAELFHRSHRLRKHLERIGPGESGEHRRLVDTMQRALEDIEDTTMGHFAELWRVLRTEDREEVQNPAPSDTATPAAEFNGLLFSLDRFSRRFATIHESLVFLPWRSIRPELVFSLEGCFPLFWRQCQPSIVMGSLFNAFEFDFIKILRQRLPDIAEVFSENERNSVLRFAICDADSPLACAILAHEVGHAIDAEHEVSSSVMSQYVGGPDSRSDILYSWCEEICADLIAARMVGPSPILSLLSMEYCLYPSQSISQHGPSHPSTRARLRIVGDEPGQPEATAPMPSELELYENAWRLDLARLFPDDNERQARKQQHDLYMDRLLLPLAQQLREKLSSLDPPLPSIAFDRVSLDRCEKRLHFGSPVSAQGEDPTLLAREVEQHRNGAFESLQARRDAFEHLCDKFTENPLGVPQILLAGYQRRCGIIEDLYKEGNPLGNEESVTQLCKAMVRVDRLIGSSIVTSCVHKEVLRRLQTNRT